MIKEIMKKISFCLETIENNIENQFKAEEIYHQQSLTNKGDQYHD